MLDALLLAHNTILVSSIVFSVPLVFWFSYKKIRPNFPARVSCWFCMRTCSVPFGNKNCWDCPQCEQYNGFRHDDDYNKPIPAQYDEDLNFPIVGRTSKKRLDFSNGLCDQCNVNQAVKIKLLASFVPVQISDEENELKAYTHHLESLYSLCWQCDIYVHKRLAEQDAYLGNNLGLNEAIMNASTDSLLDLRSSSPKAVGWLFGLSLSAILSLFYASLYELVPWLGTNSVAMEIMSNLPQSQSSLLMGFVSGMAAVILKGKDRWSLNDAVFTILWVLLQILYSNNLMDSCMETESQLYLKPIATCITLLIVAAIYRQNWKRTGKHVNRKRVTTFKLAKEPIVETILKQPQPEIIKTPPPITTSTDDLLSPLDASLNAVHITPQSTKKYLCEEDLHREFELSSHRNGCSPLVRPARFTPPPPSITHASWVAGGFWSIPSSPNLYSPNKERTAIKFAIAGFQTSGLFTPPPSVNGSQDSQRTTFSDLAARAAPRSARYDSMGSGASSTYRSAQSVYKLKSSSSINSNIAPVTMTTINTNSKSNWYRIFFWSVVSCSLIGNIYLAFLTFPIR